MPITIDNLRDFLRPGTDELVRNASQIDAQRAMMERDIARAYQMCGGDDSDGDTLVHTLTWGQIHAISIAEANSSWEGLAPMPYDAPPPVDTVAGAAKAEATECKGKSLMQAIGALQEQFTSNGRPPRFTVVED